MHMQSWSKEIREGFKDSDLSKQCVHRWVFFSFFFPVTFLRTLGAHIIIQVCLLISLSKFDAIHVGTSFL